jgi:hypothetical protein
MFICIPRKHFKQGENCVLVCRNVMDQLCKLKGLFNAVQNVCFHKFLTLETLIKVTLILIYNFQFFVFFRFLSTSVMYRAGCNWTFFHYSNAYKEEHQFTWGGKREITSYFTRQPFRC